MVPSWCSMVAVARGQHAADGSQGGALPTRTSKLTVMIFTIVWGVMIFVALSRLLGTATGICELDRRACPNDPLVIPDSSFCWPKCRCLGNVHGMRSGCCCSRLPVVLPGRDGSGGLLIRSGSDHRSLVKMVESLPDYAEPIGLNWFRGEWCQTPTSPGLQDIFRGRPRAVLLPPAR